MSGGSFNYACFKVEDGDVFSGLDDYKAIERYLRSTNKHDAANAVLRYIIEVETAYQRLMVYGRWIATVLRAAEWWDSGDTDEHGFDTRFEEWRKEPPMLTNVNE